MSAEQLSTPIEVNLEAKMLAAQTVLGIQPNDYPLPFPSIAAMLLAQQQRYAEKVFLIFYDEHNNRSQFSYDEFVTLARKTASFLAAMGIKRGDRIATAAYNHPDTIVQYFGAWMMGACVVPLNMSEDNDRLRYVLKNSGAKLLLCREDYVQRLHEFLPDATNLTIVTVFNNPATVDGFHTYLTHQQPLTPTASQLSADDASDDEALIVYTSGTTGDPKGVVLVQRNILADSEAIARWHGIDDTQRLMCVLPVHHVNGTIVTHTTPMLAGASVVLTRKFQTETFFERIHREHVHIVSVVPTLLAFLLEAQKKQGKTNNQPLQPEVPTTLRHIICGAGPLTCELARQFEKQFGVRIMHGYGLSETTCYSCFLPIDLSPEEHLHWMHDFGFPSIGVAIAPNEMAILDESGNALGAMERGEIVIRGANVMKEYYHNPEANKKTFAHGWFQSGDEGFFQRDAQGRAFFFITGRLKELIIRGGVNIAPLEIDEVLSHAPGVKAAICVGFENDFYGEEVGALVIPISPTVLKEEILGFCAQQLPFNKAPKVIVFTDTLPVTSTGKYQRNKVKHLFREWKSRQFRKDST